MNEECLICKAPLEYLSTNEKMECALCHKKQYSKTRCVNELQSANSKKCDGVIRVAVEC